MLQIVTGSMIIGVARVTVGPKKSQLYLDLLASIAMANIFIVI